MLSYSTYQRWEEGEEDEGGVEEEEENDEISDELVQGGGEWQDIRWSVHLFSLYVYLLRYHVHGMYI